MFQVAGSQPVERCQESYCDQSPEEGCDWAGLGGPLEVYTVLHPPGPDEDAAESKEEGRDGALGGGATLDGCLHLHQIQSACQIQKTLQPQLTVSQKEKSMGKASIPIVLSGKVLQAMHVNGQVMNIYIIYL